MNRNRYWQRSDWERARGGGEMALGQIKARLARLARVIIGAGEYDPEAAERDFYRTVREQGFAAMSIFPSAETNGAVRSSYTTIR